MSQKDAQKQALVTVLNRLYEEIRGLEQQHGLFGREGDYRPRVEYFHDAVRSFTAGGDLFAARGRLSVEHLAYDISLLREIQANPLKRGATGNQMSTSTDVSLGGSNARASERELRSQLSDLYANYNVMFSALLSEAADKNYHARVDELNSEVEQLAEVETVLKEAEKGKASDTELMSMLEMVEDPELRAKINALLHAKKGKKEALDPAKRALKDGIKRRDADIAKIEEAHFHYATGQLAIYEHGKETVKNLAGQGMNLAGQFVASAMQNAHGQNRGNRGR